MHPKNVDTDNVRKKHKNAKTDSLQTKLPNGKTQKENYNG